MVPFQSLLVAALCLHRDPPESSFLCSWGADGEWEGNLLCVAFLTSASAATSSLLASPCAGAGAGAGTGSAGAGAGALLLSAGVASVFAGAGAGAVAGAGAGAVSVFAGSAAGVACDGVSVVAVGFGSSFLDFFLKRPLKAFFICSIASGGTPGMMIGRVSGRDAK
ncbi:hypothetical protein JI435_308690 [Parastagonospora nodorum SN15]|uniref:Uncharacterized protein n=1 Tax=Phaeosphaeria nodorum (strain SN15 / ATCC MYA-4574 / FGSC 10173) TaxID=321614 RepID=A0A7U2NR13_PHANO|nr:hypothetical protein JI435_308690 [Parastagonospora nodorum SN15]